MLKKTITKFLPYLFLLSVTIANFWEYLVFNEYLIGGDTRHITYPLNVALFDSFKNWTLPLWNPDIQMGFPLLAEGQIGAFYPINAIFSLIFLPATANNLSIILHVFLSGIFTYIYARTISAGIYSSTVSALIFMLSGFVISETVQTNTLNELIWLPLAFVFLELLLKKGRPVYSFLLGLILSIQFFGGQPQYSAYTFWALIFYLVFNIYTGRLELNSTKKTVKKIFISLFSFCFGLGISAIQLLPTLELLQYSVRNANFSLHDSFEQSFLPFNLIGFLFPFFLHIIYENGKVYYLSGGPLLSSAYVGILPLALASFTLFKRMDRTTKFFTVLCIASILLSFGKYNPLNILIYKISGLSYFRIHARFLYLSTFSLSILAGKGLDLLFQNEFKKYLGKVATSISIVICTLILILVTAKSLLHNSVSLGLLSKHKNDLNMLLSLENPHILIPFILMFGTLLFFIFLNNKRTLRGIETLLLSLIICDLSYFATHHYSIKKWEGAKTFVGYKPKSINFLNTDKSIFRISTLADKFIFDEGLIHENLLNTNYNLIHHIASFNIFSPLVMQRHKEIEEALAIKSENLAGHDALLPNSNLNLFSLLNVKYMLSQVAINGKGLQQVFRDGSVRIYQNMNVLPRAFVVFKAKKINDPEAIKRELFSENFSGHGYVILEENIPFDTNDKDFFDIEADVKILKYLPNEITLSVRQPKNGYLVLSDTYYPGWKAYVDGESTKIFRANYLMRAIKLSEGNHNVVFRYEPLSFRIGLYITLISLCVGIMICLGTGRKEHSFTS